MTCIDKTHSGSRDDSLGVKTGGRNPPPTSYGFGSAVSSPSGVPSGAPTVQRFSTIYSTRYYETVISIMWSIIIIMRPSSVGGAAYCVALCLSVCLSVGLSVCLSVRPVRGSSFVIVYITTVLRANIQNRKTSVFDYRPASTLRTCGIFCFVYICGPGPHTVGRSAAQACYFFITGTPNRQHSNTITMVINGDGGCRR